MPHAANLKLCVLWEDELRKAAKLLHAAETVFKREGETDDYAAVASMAYAACRIALLGLEDDAQIAMVAKPEIRQTQRPKKPNKRPNTQIQRSP